MATIEAADLPPGGAGPQSGEGGRSVTMQYLDGILRDRETYFQRIFNNESVARQIVLLISIVILLTGLHGVVMGLPSSWQQMLLSAVKVPTLYLLTLFVCYPVLYVVNVIMGSHLGFLQTLALILVAMALNAILLASCTPIVLFFTLTGASYDFLKLLHVAIFAFCGLWAMMGLWKGLVSMCESSSLYPKQAIRIMQVWIVIFGFVGTQVAWSLRPFIGSPDREFELFREGVDMNFYEAILSSFLRLAGVS